MTYSDDPQPPDKKGETLDKNEHKPSVRLVFNEKVTYIFITMTVAATTWIATSIHALEQDRTKNADHIEALQKEYSEVDIFMHERAYVPRQLEDLVKDITDMKTSRDAYRASLAMILAKQDARIDELQNSLTILKTRIEIHLDEDERRFKDRPAQDPKHE